jgi:selenocysteine lyase/cysteine desulfurase
MMRALSSTTERFDRDFCVVMGYKWLLCPSGIGFLHAATGANDPSAR